MAEAAEFIGSYLAQALLRNVEGIQIIGVDNMNDYYDVSLKEYRLSQTKELARKKAGSERSVYPKNPEGPAIRKNPESPTGSKPLFTFIRGDIGDARLVRDLFARYRPSKEQSEDSGIPYQTLINLYLSDCAKQKKQLQISWK